MLCHHISCLMMEKVMSTSHSHELPLPTSLPNAKIVRSKPKQRDKDSSNFIFVEHKQWHFIVTRKAVVTTQTLEQVLVIALHHSHLYFTFINAAQLGTKAAPLDPAYKLSYLPIANQPLCFLPANLQKSICTELVILKQQFSYLNPW